MDILRRILLALLLAKASLFAVGGIKKDQFISNVLNAALDVKRAFANDVAVKIPNSLIIGMASLESGYGTSILARNSNNYFGMKSGKDFAKFHNLRHSVEAYIRNISTNKVYKKFQAAILNGEQNPHKLIALIAIPYSGGEKTYATKIKSIISSNSLQNYDSHKIIQSLPKKDFVFLKDFVNQDEVEKPLVLIDSCIANDEPSIKLGFGGNSIENFAKLADNE